MLTQLPHSELQALNPDLHWFCPRESPTDPDAFYAEDIVAQLSTEPDEAKYERHKRIKGAEERQKLVLAVLQIIAFDGPDAEQYKEWLREHLAIQLTNCDICVRQYYRARRDLKKDLEQVYEETEVQNFLEQLDNINIDRIISGLDHAKDLLLKAEPPNRDISSLDSKGVYSIFEALNCEAFLRREDLLKSHFDQPFQLVQTRKRLRLGTLLPAHTYFLFSPDAYRFQWAENSYGRIKRNMTVSEFKNTVRAPLFSAMAKVPLQNLQAAFLPTFWN
ncbi:hypothetical protein LTS18_014677, partial [Coniosporium uncinatum]